MKNDSQKIEAVFDRDLEKVLKGINLYEKIIDGEIKCHFCDKKITLKNLQFIFTKNNEVKVSCDDKDCEVEFRKIIKNGI